MDASKIKIVLAIAVVLLGLYLISQRTDKAPPESTLETSKATTTIIATTVPQSTIPIGPDALPECVMMDTSCKRDRCYFGNALNRQSTKLCQQIAEPQMMVSCIEMLSYNQTLEKATVEGRIFNTKTCGVYQNLTVEIVDAAQDITAGISRTNAIGEYRFLVESGKDYGIYVTVGDKIINQDLKNVSKRVYVVDFALS